ncbi:phenylacetate-CoA oxygenase/reductase subunit PaaK [Streptomyces calidiresistens]|uniref:2Fe-2S iron-sulfur cluster binding domain-containing protein n=1 Tax=Streptomyces calidiresistens TaxID=1485586 RepID=A0A7W3T1W9_9ACTN|nr:2Fe-2S iron-sulfur cluster-binding protein [Streptomyces calidiresistens]MBB0229429.1 2Fe-2S iron-sulfur cluster binding domain-containing protein [Streptomyces calidiresistens]
MFHELRVEAVERQGPDAVAVTLAVPEDLRAAFRFLPGQHLTLRHRAEDGTELRRNYSICTPATDPDGPADLTIGIRRLPGGVFSAHAVERLAVGDTLSVMPPAGRFTLVPKPGRVAAITGGSGITPVLSMASTLLAVEPEARFTLLRSERTAADGMFVEEVAELKDRYPDRFQLVHSLTREDLHAGPASGRLDADRLRTLLPALLPVADVDAWYLCGPPGLIDGARTALGDLEVPRERVRTELYHPDDARDVPTGPVRAAAPGGETTGPARGAMLTATLDGRSGGGPVGEGETLLDAVLRGRPDAPYACKGGVCGTCRALLVRGEVRMDRNYALESEELDAGFVLACQSRPLTPEVELDFDR